MLVMLKSHMSKSEGLSNRESYGAWLKEAEAVVAACKAGTIKGIWKVAGKPEILTILEIESVDALEAAMLSFPFRKLGFSHLVNFELNVLRPYDKWQEDLKVLTAP